MKKIFSLTVCALLTGSLFAINLPDSVREAASKETRIARGFTFDFQGSVGLGAFTASTDHVSPVLSYPDWNAGIGINYFFLPYMGLGTGVDFAVYRRQMTVGGTFQTDATDYEGQNYTLTATPDGIREYQRIGYIEVPLALRFRAIPHKVGFSAALGVKFAVPMLADYGLKEGGQLLNSVYYPHWDLTMQDVPGVIENQPIAATTGTMERSELQQLNYVGYAEMGLLFQLARRLDMSLSVYGSYFINPVLQSSTPTGQVGFGAYTVGEYAAPYQADYQGLMHTKELADYRPWSVGLKVGLHINAGMTEAERRYRKEQRRLKREAEQAPAEAEVAPVAVDPVDSAALAREQFVADSIEARAEIVRLADRYGIDLCDMCSYSTIYIHDTVYVRIDRVPEQTPAAQMDEILSTGIVHFEFDKTTPMPEPEDLLVRVSAFLREHPDMHVCINGHTCIIGNDQYNRRLALRRAEAVQEQLIEMGVKPEQMTIHALGSDVPYRYHVDNHYSLSEDRRVEIVPDCSEGSEIVNPNQNVTRVVAGSHLASIARHHYGNPDYWKYIWQANRDVLPDPNQLKVGMMLRLPTLDEVEQMKQVNN